MDVKRAADLYAKGRTLRQIGAELGVPWAAVGHQLRSGGVTMRRGGRQIAARGVAYLDSTLTPLETRTFAITGGTDVYANARGHISEQPTQPSGTENWLLNILYGVGRLGRGYLPEKC